MASLFTIEAREYANIAFDAASRAMARNVILALCIGIFLAALYSVYQRSVPGGIVRALIGAGAHTPESAKSLEELGLSRNPFSRLEIRRNAMLRRFLRPTEGGEGAACRYYIPEEQKYAAEVRFEKGGNPVITLILTAACSLLLAIVLIKLLPGLLSIADNLMK